MTEVLKVSDLRFYFDTRHGMVKAVDGISFALRKGEVLGIVGESGSGKSVTNRALMGLLPKPPGRVVSGQALYAGKDLFKLSRGQLRKICGNKISMIFQDPMTSLNPFLKIGTQLMESLLVHDKATKKESKKLVIASLESIGIQDAEKRLKSYPHEFSGGMRQRVMIAMALLTNPDILIADEPTTALDVTVEAQILDLIRLKQKQTGMAVIYITHNLAVLAGLADEVAVMYAGKIMETGDVDQIFYESKHPYTKALLASLPSTHAHGEKLYTIPGLPPDVSRKMPACAFAPRCEQAQNSCDHETMTLKEIQNGQQSACLRVQRGEISL